MYFCSKIKKKGERKWLFLRARNICLLGLLKLLLHAFVEPNEREGIITKTKRLFVRARTNRLCLKKFAGYLTTGFGFLKFQFPTFSLCFNLQPHQPMTAIFVQKTVYFRIYLCSNSFDAHENFCMKNPSIKPCSSNKKK